MRRASTRPPSEIHPLRSTLERRCWSSCNARTPPRLLVAMRDSTPKRWPATAAAYLFEQLAAGGPMPRLRRGRRTGRRISNWRSARARPRSEFAKSIEPLERSRTAASLVAHRLDERSSPQSADSLAHSPHARRLLALARRVRRPLAARRHRATRRGGNLQSPSASRACAASTPSSPTAGFRKPTTARSATASRASPAHDVPRFRGLRRLKQRTDREPSRPDAPR